MVSPGRGQRVSFLPLCPAALADQLPDLVEAVRELLFEDFRAQAGHQLRIRIAVEGVVASATQPLLALLSQLDGARIRFPLRGDDECGPLFDHTSPNL